MKIINNVINHSNNRLHCFLWPLLVICLLLGQVRICFSDTVENGYDKSDSDFEQGYIDAFGWDSDKINAQEWTGEDGAAHEKYSFGFQKEAFEDILDALIAQLEDQGYVLDLTDGVGNDPSSNKRASGMVQVALAEVGKERSIEDPKGSNDVFYNNWYYGQSVTGNAYAWCGTFISWCANECGYLDTGLFTKTASCAVQYRYLTNTQGFSSHRVSDISQFGGSYEAVPGDLVFWKNGTELTHMGIVTDTSDSSIDITQGNCSSRVCTVAYSRGNLKANPTLAAGYIVHVEYPAFAFDGECGEIQDTVFLFLTQELGLSSAAACGLMGNFQIECGWNLDAVGDNGTSYGLCQWHEERWRQMISFCSSNGYDAGSLEGQLRYLEYELTQTSEGAVMNSLSGASDSESGAKNTALLFARQFERCTSDSYSARQNYASYFWQIYGGRSSL